MKIVTANYRDRGSEFPWLVRDEAEHPEQAVACRNVLAVAVAFGQANDYERRHGCTAAARCEEALLYNDEDKRPKILCTRFDLNAETFTEPGLAPWFVAASELRIGSPEDIGLLKSRLRFYCGGFYDEADGRATACELLELAADRSMHAYFLPQELQEMGDVPFAGFQDLAGDGFDFELGEPAMVGPFGRLAQIFSRA